MQALQSEFDAWFDLYAEQVRLLGWQVMVRQHVLLPSDRYFPDSWTPNVDGAGQMLARLMTYAGLGDMPFTLVAKQGTATVAHQDDAGLFGRGQGERRSGAAAWYMGIHDGCYFFGVDDEQLDEPDGLAAALAHEVAHAWRETHRVVHEDHDVEEFLTDLTTIYLGFGLLTTNAAYRYRKWETSAGVVRFTHQAHVRTGYVPARAMAELLAADAVVRGMTARELGYLRTLLEPNQAHVFGRAADFLVPQRAALLHRLDIPDESQWQAPIDLRVLITDVDAPTRRRQVRKLAQDPSFNRGFRVPRVAATPTGHMSVRVLVAGGAILALWLLANWLADLEIPTSGLIWLCVAVPVASLVDARRRQADRCGDPQCQSTLPLGVLRCPKCGGALVAAPH